MRRVSIIIMTVFAGSTLISCSGISSSDEYSESMKLSGNQSEENTVFAAAENSNERKVAETHNDVRYKIDLLSAKDFIERKGERVAKSDVQKLKKESVLILEMHVNDRVKSALESSKMVMSKEDAVSYLMSGIIKDVTIGQKKETFKPYEVLYDGHLTGANKLRVFLFFQDVDLNKTSKIQFYDRLFGAGLINLKH